MKFLAKLAFLIALAGCAQQPVTNREPAAAPTFFENSRVEIELKADFTAIFANKEQRAQGEESGPRKTFPGTLRLISPASSQLIPVEINARGNSNLSDCDFPKLKVDFKKSAVAGTPLDGLASLRINTHCAERSETGLTGNGSRVTGDRGPVRESFVYDVLDLLGLPHFRTRLAKVVYLQNGKPTLRHQALLIESKKDMGIRLGGKVVEEFNYDETPDPRAFLDSMNQDQIARAEFFHALIGNRDRFVGVTDVAGEFKNNPIAPMPPIWNYSLLRATPPLLIPYDFDVAQMVTQLNQASDPEVRKVSGCKNTDCEEVFSSLQEIRPNFSRTTLDRTREFYFQALPTIAKAVDASPKLSVRDKSIWRNRLALFREILKNQFYVPVIAAKGAKLYLDANLTQACGEDGGPDERVEMTIPVGYAVKVLERSSRAIKVKVLNQMFRPMVNPVTGLVCPNHDTWLAPEVTISPDFPR